MFMGGDNTDLTPNPICPYCGHEDYDLGVELLVSDPCDGDMSLAKCFACNKSFNATVNINTSFSTSITDLEFDEFAEGEDEFEIEVHPYDGDGEE